MKGPEFRPCSACPFIHAFGLKRASLARAAAPSPLRPWVATPPGSQLLQLNHAFALKLFNLVCAVARLQQDLLAVLTEGGSGAAQLGGRAL